VTTTNTLDTKLSARILDGLTAKIRSTLSTIQGTNSTIYFTISDIVYEMILRMHSGLDVNYATFSYICTRTSAVLAQMNKNGNEKIHTTSEKIEPRSATRKYPNVKLSTGYRIGSPITPLMSRDMKDEKRVYEIAAKAVAANPLEAILPVIPMLTMAQLTQLSVEILAAKDDLYLKLQEQQFNAALNNPRTRESEHEHA
jgi:hypothetical protein